MPWSNQGGPGDRNNSSSGRPQGPWGQGSGGSGGPNSQPPDLEEFLRRSQEVLNQFLPSGFGGNGLGILVLFGVLAWMLSGFYTVGPNEIGLNLVFGKYLGKTQAGLNYNLPAPIGSVIKLAVTRMLPGGPLGREMIKKLKVYSTDKHPHVAQNPVTLEVR